MKRIFLDIGANNGIIALDERHDIYAIADEHPQDASYKRRVRAWYISKAHAVQVADGVMVYAITPPLAPYADVCAIVARWYAGKAHKVNLFNYSAGRK